VPVYEGFGMVVVEAMAAGRPVVGNDAPGGVSDIVVHGETGLIVPAGSAEALAQALAYLVDSPQERARLGRHGRARQEQHFSARGMVERIAEAYVHALRRRPSHSPSERVGGMVSADR
jgi:glycosyltransferase involved in cell wall biosynthesis